MIDRFMTKVEKTSDCWLWQGAISDSGYGWFGIGGSGNTQSAHRVAHQLLIGPIPNGMHVCHRCDVRHCVNPSHLFLGSRSDNMQDMLTKGRGNKAAGERNGNAKLTDEQVAEIKTSGLPARVFVERYGITRGAVAYHRAREMS